MCEHCRTAKSWHEPISTQDATQCEWLPDLSDMPEMEEPLELADELEVESCERMAAVLFHERYVEDHLCAQHTAEVLADLADEELQALLETAALQEESEMLPIHEDEACEYIGSLTEITECNKKATHALVVTVAMALCTEHAAEQEAAEA